MTPITSRPRTILVAEDSPVTTRILSAILENSGIRVVTARTVVHAFESALVERPDLILVDLFLEDGDSFRLVQVLRRDPLTASIPMIAMSSVEIADLGEWARRAGCDGFVPKPYEAQGLAWHLARLEPAAGTPTGVPRARPSF